MTLQTDACISKSQPTDARCANAAMCFSECFAALAKAEYAIATGEKRYAEEALALFKEVQRFISTPGILEPKYLPTQPAQGHSVTMILINTAATIRRVISDPALDHQIQLSIDTLSKYFIHPEYKALLETVGPEGELIDTLAGRTINPRPLHRDGMVSAGGSPPPRQ